MITTAPRGEPGILAVGEEVGERTADLGAALEILDLRGDTLQGAVEARRRAGHWSGAVRRVPKEKTSTSGRSLAERRAKRR